jgi:hypothetical protein
MIRRSRRLKSLMPCSFLTRACTRTWRTLPPHFESAIAGPMSRVDGFTQVVFSSSDWAPEIGEIVGL